MSSALSVKMNGPLATLERMLPQVGEACRPEMHKAIETLRQVCQLPIPVPLIPGSRLLYPASPAPLALP